MKKIELPFCFLYLEDRYAILEMKKDCSINIDSATEITVELERVYEKRPFIFITHRKHHNPIDLNVYKGRILKNMIGFAIVSNDPKERVRAATEQPLWENAFTFFTDLEDAKSWAESFFSS